MKEEENTRSESLKCSIKTICKIYTFDYIQEIKDKWFVGRSNTICDGGFPISLRHVGKELVYQTDSWEDALLAIKENRTDLIEARKICALVVEEQLGVYEGFERKKYFRSISSDEWEEIELM